MPITGRFLGQEVDGLDGFILELRDSPTPLFRNVNGGVGRIPSKPRHPSLGTIVHDEYTTPISEHDKGAANLPRR